MSRLKTDTLVIVAGKVATIQQSERRYGSDGYMIYQGSGYARFVQDWQVHRAEIGVTVCAEQEIPGPWCCPLVHPTPDQIKRIRAQG